MLGKIEDRSWRGQRSRRWLDGIIDSKDMAVDSWQTLEDSEGQGSLDCCSLWGCKDNLATEQQQKTYTVKHLFIYFAIFLSSLVRYLFNSLAHFYWVACFLVVEFLESFIYLDASSLLDMCFTNIFSDLSFHSLSDVFCRRHWVFATPETIQSMEFSRPEYWSRLPSAGDAPNPEMEPRSSVFQVDSLPAELPGKPIEDIRSYNFTEVPITNFFIS